LLVMPRGLRPVFLPVFGCSVCFCCDLLIIPSFTATTPRTFASAELRRWAGEDQEGAHDLPFYAYRILGCLFLAYRKER
jgi:hypothetical protein